MLFPQYRKYPNNKSFFKIFSTENFEELNIIGSRYTISIFTARIHPDRMFILDMLHNQDQHFIVITPEEYEEALEHCHQNLHILE